MSVFDLDPQGRKSLDQQAALNPLDLSTIKPGFFDGLGKATVMGVERGGARAGNAVALAGATLPIAIDSLDSWISGEEHREASDWYFKNVVDDTTASAVDWWTPDAAQVGTAGNVLGGLAEMVLPLAAGGGNPSLLAATAGLDRPAGLIKQGVDAKTAGIVGGVETLTTLAGFKLPAAFGNTLTQRLATGGLSNLALGAGGSAAQYGALKAGGYDEQAKAYDPLDPTARTVDLLTGLAFGGLAHVSAPKAPLAERDALLTARNADSFQRNSAPFPPASEGAAVRGQQATEQAIDQLVRGDPVSVLDTIQPSDFILPPRPADAGTSGFSTSNEGYAAYRRALESGFRADARNRASSAAGIDQFTDATWRNIVARTKPAWAQGLSDAELLAARLDPAKSTEMVDALDAEHAAALQGAGLDASAHNLYAAHHFGINRAKAFARAAGNTPMDRLLSAEQLDANPYLKGLTKAEATANWDQRAARAGVRPDGALVDTNPAGQALRRRLVDEPDQLVQDYAALEDSKGGTVLNTDTARELSPEYLADRTRSADVHEAASDFVKMLYERKLAEPTPEGFDRTVLFTAGGTGAGKTSGLKAMGDALGRPEIVYDTNMNTLASAVKKIDQALAAGRDVEIAYVYRDPVDALVGGAIHRAQGQAKEFGTGRTVPLAEHAKTHAGVRGVMEEITRRYAGNDHVHLTAIDNSRGKDRQAVVELADLPKVEQNGLHERLSAALEQARAAGLDERIYRGFAGQAARDRGLEGNRGVNRGQDQVPPGADGNSPRLGNGGRPEPGSRGQVSAAETTLEAAARQAGETPDATVIAGFDADGKPVYSTVADAMDSIVADQQRAEADARAFPAAVSCFLRRGA